MPLGPSSLASEAVSPMMAAFCRRVVGRACHPDRAGTGGDTDDPAPARFLHPGHDSPTGPECRSEDVIHDGPPGLVRDPCDPLGPICGRGCHQDGNRTQLLRDVLDHRPDLLSGLEVGTDGDRPTAAVADLGRGRFGSGRAG